MTGSPEGWERVQGLFRAPHIAFLAVTEPDGAPHVSPVWVTVEDGLIRLTTGERTAKRRALRVDPRVAISVHASSDPLVAATVFGRVVAEVTGDEAVALGDRISIAYEGEPWDWQPGERERTVALSIAPERVASMVSHP
jgi:PPOX class probable F420-dependent enzyme